MEQDLIAVRIKDGIFAGNVVAAEDREFLGMNKITHVINCAGGEVADYFAGDPELRYLSFPWKDTAGPVCTTVLFDAADTNIKRAVQFIDEALEAGSCVLVHSFYGVSRAPALIAAYFIVKYGWKLESALGFLEMAHPDISIKPHFLRQLRLFAKNHNVERDVFDTAVDDSKFGLDNDQWMLRNTLLNGLAFEEQQANELYKLCSKTVDVGAPTGRPKRHGRLVFVDTQKGTGVDSAATTPVVNVKPVQHIDPNAAPGAPQFMGSQGATVIRTGRRSPSILSRSVSPCRYRLESDAQSCPKGRQSLPLRESEKEKHEREVLEKENEKPSRRVASTPDESQTVQRAPALHSAAVTSAAAPKTVVRTNSTRSIGTANSETEKKTQSPRRGIGSTRTSSDLKRLSPPSAQSAPSRSPFATLTSTHKYRNGSPLPLKGAKKKVSSSGAVRSKPSSPHSSPARSAGGREPNATPPPATDGSSTTVVRGSPATSTTATRASAASGGYRGIAPQRATVRKSSVGADARDSAAVPGTISPGLRSSSAKARTGSAKGRTRSPVGSTANGSGRKVSRSGSADGKPKASATSSSASFSEKSSIARPTSSSAARNAATNADNNGAPGGTIRRQPATGISSRRQQ